MYIITENLVIREAVSTAIVDDVDIANKALPDYISGEDALKAASASHPEISKLDLVETARIMFCFFDKTPEVYEILSRENGQVIGYLQLIHMNRKTPSFDIRFYPDSQCKGYGTEVVWAVIEELKKNPKYTSLLGLVLAHYPSYISWLEKLGATELKQSNQKVRLLIRVFSFPLK